MLDQMIEMAKVNMKSLVFGSFTNNSVGKKHHKFQDSIIISYSNSSGNISGDYSVINRKKGTYYKLSKKDSLIAYRKNSPYNYKTEENIKVQEFRDIVKNISGFECFKIIITVPENTDDSDEEFKNLFKDAETIYELYVTGKIKCKYHPYFQYKSILEKYYPLEIIERPNFIEGSEIRYNLVDLVLF